MGTPALFVRASVLAGARHGFATRHGGVSTGPYASLNLGRQTADDASAVAENHRRLAAAAGFDAARLATPARQIHGATVVRARTPAQTECDCDAVVSGEPGLAVGIRTADCVPVLLWHGESGRAGAVHAGWRGVAASIVPAAVSAMDAPPSEIAAAIGPSIGLCCYEVDDATATKIATAAPALGAVPTRPGHVRVDLAAAVRGQLLAAGLDSAHVEMAGGCTSCDAARWFSHRRDRGTTGRHLSFIVAGSLEAST